MNRISHDGPQDVQLSRVFSFQKVQLGDGEVVGMEARGSSEARAAGRRALSIDILRWLEKSVDQISYELILSVWVSRPAVVKHGSGERVQGHSIRDVEEQPQQEGHYHTHGQRSPQHSNHEN